MNKSNRLLWIAAVLTLGFQTGCAQLGYQRAPKKGEVEHVVLLWLKEPGNAAQRERLVEVTRSFEGIPGIRSISAGAPLASDRPVVDDSFDVALVIRFESKAALDAYEVHPVHTKAVKEVLLPVTRKLVVHDYTVQ